MSLQTLEGILRAISNKPVTKFVLIGGEPTVHKELPDILRRLQPTKVGMVSNGVKLSDKHYLNFLRDCGLSSVLISLKGASQGEYLANTGVACLDRVEQAIVNLSEIGMSYNISITFSASVMESLSKILEWVKSSGSGSISINYCRPYIFNGQVSVEGVPTPQEMAQKTILNYNMIRSSGVRCTFSFLLPLCLLPRDFIDLLVERNELSTVCQLQKSAGLIFEPDGSIIPCHHLFDYKLGRLGKDFVNATEFDAFMNRPNILKFYRRAAGLPDPKCQICDLKGKCGGGCLVQHLQYSPTELELKPFERRVV